MTVAWRGGELFIHDASQCVSHTAWSLAGAFGLEEKQVHVTSPFLGGGFGSKTLWQHHVLAAAKLAGRPVRLALSREGVCRTVTVESEFGDLHERMCMRRPSRLARAGR